MNFFPMYYVLYIYTFIYIFLAYGQNPPAFLGRGGPLSEHVIFVGKNWFYGNGLSYIPNTETESDTPQNLFFCHLH